ncbi:hypothetical protein D3C86_1400140 [compost metagenome]
MKQTFIQIIRTLEKLRIKPLPVPAIRGKLVKRFVIHTRQNFSIDFFIPSARNFHRPFFFLSRLKFVSESHRFNFQIIFAVSNLQIHILGFHIIKCNQLKLQINSRNSLIFRNQSFIFQNSIFERMRVRHRFAFSILNKNSHQSIRNGRINKHFCFLTTLEIFFWFNDFKERFLILPKRFLIPNFEELLGFYRVFSFDIIKLKFVSSSI